MKKLAALFCHNALSCVAGDSPGERADHLEFAADILAAHELYGEAAAARKAAGDLREAEASQLKFQALLSSVRE